MKGRHISDIAAKDLLIVAFALAAAVLNLTGGVLFDSKVLIVNGLTCVANFVTALGTVMLMREASKPPDVEHQFGHAGYAVGASVITMIVYAFTMGLGVEEVWVPKRYEVNRLAWVVPLAVLVLYSLAMWVLRGRKGGYSAYSSMTWGELAESAVALAATPLAHYVSFWFDWAAATGLLGYYSVQIALGARDVIYRITVPSPPKELYESVRRDIEGLGVEVKELRLRVLGYTDVGGYAVIGVDPQANVVEAHYIASSVESLVRDKYGIALVVHVEPRDRKAS